MTIHDATEIAYKRGYEAGKQAAVKHGRWKESLDYHRECSLCGFPAALWEFNRFCPNCGAMMDEPQPAEQPRITDQTKKALEAMGRKVHKEETE